MQDKTQQIEDFLTKENITYNTFIKGNEIFDIFIRGNSRFEFYNKMYNNSTVCLERKPNQ